VTAELTAWIEHVEGLGEPSFPVALPGPHDLVPVLLELAVPHEDIEAMAALRLSPPELRLLRLSVHALAHAMGDLTEPPRFPQFAELSPYFTALVFAAARPLVRAYHRERGIPAGLSRLILADLGRNMAVHRRRHGTPGLAPANWVQRHFRGMIYQLGRLQFELVRLETRLGEAIRAAGMPWGPGDPVLSTHIPDYYGPLSPHACEESLRRAAVFFPRHFPEYDLGLAVCQSWLLDPQLAGHLPAGSNILAFQRMFTPALEPDEHTSILRFVRPGTRLGDIVQSHLDGGGVWHVGSGWLRLSDHAPRWGAPRSRTRI
jgi:GNAT-like C-terminal domain/N-acyltransferase N-terminal domain